MEIIDELKPFLIKNYTTSEDLANVIKTLYAFTKQPIGNFKLKLSDHNGNELEITTELIQNANVDPTLFPYLEKLLTLINTKYNENYIADFICANAVEMSAHVMVNSRQLMLPIKYQLEMEVNKVLKRGGIIED